MLQTDLNNLQARRIIEEAPTIGNAEGLRPLPGIGTRSSRDALAVRDKYKEFFEQDRNVPWQDAYIRRGTIE
jgi:hypothetical protein